MGGRNGKFWLGLVIGAAVVGVVWLAVGASYKAVPSESGATNDPVAGFTLSCIPDDPTPARNQLVTFVPHWESPGIENCCNPADPGQCRVGQPPCPTPPPIPDDGYTWSAPGGNPPAGAGDSFATRYASNGNKTVTVRYLIGNHVIRQGSCPVQVGGTNATPKPQ